MSNNKKYSLWLLILILISILIGCSKEDVKPKYSDLQGNWKFNFIQTDTISGNFQILKSDQQYFTSGTIIKKGDLYIALGEVKLGNKLIISNSEKYLLTDTVTIYSLSPNLIILNLNKIKSNNNISISCNSQSLYYNNWKYYTNSLTINRY